MMCLCDQLRKLVAQVRPVGRMSLEPCYTIKTQKHSKEIVKIIHVTSGVLFSGNFTKLHDYFLCAKKTKITTLFNNSSPPVTL